jgi:RND family efflux transporter MFP subunit
MVRKTLASIPVSSSGRLATRDEIKLSFKTGGIIEDVYVQEGEQVKAGQLIARLEQSEFVAAATQSELALEKAVRDFDRISNLYNDSVSTLEQYQNARTALEAAKQTYTVVTFNLEHSEIRAPAIGRILRKTASAGETVGAGIPVALFGSTDNRWVLQVGITDKDAVRIRIGDSAVVFMDAFPRMKFHAEVTEISGMADPYTGTFEVELMLEVCKQGLATGLIGTALIYPDDRRWYFMVPTDALIEGEGGVAEIYRVVDSVAKRTRINAVAIRGGYIYAGDPCCDSIEVIRTGLQFISDGTRVSPVLSR